VNHLRQAIKVIVNILTCILLMVLVLVIYGKVAMTFNNTFPNYFGYTFFEVASGSMEPTLQIDDVILVKITKENLAKGDIIAFVSDNTVITHRIIYMEGDTLTVKGDNNNIVDKPITTNQVIGKIIKVFPKLGIWKKVVTEPKILLAIFITLLVFDFALSFNKENEKEKKKEKKVINKEEEVIVKEVPKEAPVKVTKKRDVTEADKLLELTRKIDIEEINRLLEGTDYKLEKKEINNIKKELAKNTEPTPKKEDNHKGELNLSEKEKKFVEYTMRLDLKEIQKKINSKVK